MKKKLRLIVLIIYLLTTFVLLLLVFKKNLINTSEDSVVDQPIATLDSFITQTQATEKTVKINQEISQEKVVNKISATVIVDKFKFQTSFEPGLSLYDVLLMEKNNKRLNFSGKEFSDMGFFVTSIGDLKEQDNKHLIYFVNGQSPTVGISNYVLKDQDVVEWKLK